MGINMAINMKAVISVEEASHERLHAELQAEADTSDGRIHEIFVESDLLRSSHSAPEIGK